MERIDDSLNFQETLKEDFHGTEDEQHNSNKKKFLFYSISIVLTVTIITSILFVGYFNLGWFKNDENNIDIRIKSFANQALISKEKEEDSKEEEIGKTSDSKTFENDSISKKQLRNLAFEGSFSKSWTLASLNILGKTVSIKYQITLASGKLKNYLTVSCGSVSFSFGNTSGTSSNKSQSKISTGDKVLFTVPFPGTPIPVQYSFKIGGTIGYNVKYDTSTKKFTISLNGQLNAKAELGATVNGATAVSVGAKGTLISITATSTLSKTTGSTYTSSNSISTSGSEISGNVSGTLTNKQTFNVNKKFSSGWTKTLS